MNGALRRLLVALRHKSSSLSLVVSLLLLGLGSGAALAADFTFVGTGTNGNWGDNTQWLFANAPPTNGANTDIFIEGSDSSPDVQDIFNNNVAYNIDSLTLASGYSGTSTMALSGGTLTIGNFIANENTSAQLEFNQVVRMGGLGGLNVNANDDEIDFDAAVDFRLNNQTLSVSGGNNVLFDGGLTDSQNFITTATLSISGGTFVRLGADSDVLTQINITDGELLLNAASPLDSNTNIDLFSNGTFDLNNNSQNIDVLTGSGSVDLGTATLTFGESANVDASFEFSGVISGTGGITKNQSGEAVLSGANTYSGVTRIENGTLRTSGDHRIGNASAINVVSGTFDINGNQETVERIEGSGNIMLGAGGLLRVDQDGGSYTFSGTISESGELEKDGTATLILSGSNSFSLLDIDVGTVQVSSQNNMGSGSVQLSGGTLNTTATFTNSLPILTNASNSTISVNNATTLTQTGVISGSGELVKDGPGSLNLSANNTYTGNTEVNDGTLRYTGSNRISNSSDLVIAAGASVQLQNFTDTVSSLSGGGLISTGGSSGRLTVNLDSVVAINWDGAITGSGGLTKSGTHTMNITSAQSFTGAAIISEGTLSFTGSGSFSSSSDVSVSSGAAWDLNGINDTVDSIQGAGTIRLDGALLAVDENSGSTRTFSGPILGPGSFGKNGSHRLVLSGANTFDGELSISAGTLEVASSVNLGSTSANIVFFGGALNATGTISNSRDVTIGPFATATFDVDASTTFTQSGAVAADSTTTLTKNGGGTFALTSANGNGFVGDIVINAGTLQFGSGNTVGNATDVTVNSGGTFSITQTEGIDQLSGAGNVTLAGGQLLEVGLDNATSTFSGVISGSSGLFAKAGTGTLTLSGNNTYAGATTISGGTLRLSGAGRLADFTDVSVSGATFDLNDVSDAIDALSGSGSVTLGTGSSLNSLTVGSNNGSGSFTGVISESGHLVKVGSGTQTLTGNNTYSGTTSFDGGTLSTASLSNLGSGFLNFDTGTWRVTGTFTNNRATSIDANSTGTIEVNSGQTLTQSGLVSGVGADLIKEGLGTLIYAGNINHSGDNIINGGTVRLAASHRINNNSDVVVAAGATFDLDGFFETVESISGAGDVTLGNGGTLQVDATSGSFVFSGVISETGSLVKLNDHTLTLSGANTYTGPTSINGGTIRFNASNNLGDANADLTFDGGTLDLTDNNVAFSAGRSITLNSGGGTFLFSDGGLSLDIPGVISGIGTLSIDGGGEENPLTLSAVNTYSGGSNFVDAALVRVSQNANLGDNAGVVTLEGTSILSATASFTNQHAIVLSGSGGVLEAGGRHNAYPVGRHQRRGDADEVRRWHGHPHRTRNTRWKHVDCQRHAAVRIRRIA